MEIDYCVVKDNYIIQKANYSLSATEQKLILYIISKIKPEDSNLKDYSFRMIDLMDVLGLEEGKRSREQIETALSELRKKELVIDTKPKRVKCGWLNDVVFYRDEYQTVTVSINKNLKPYLIELSEKFTQYQLRQIMTMKSRYSIRLYEICKSHSFETHFTIGIEELKTMLESKYVWRDLKSKILDPVKDEINNKSDLLMDYMPIKTGRKYTDIRFTVLQKDRTEALQTQAREERKLYGYEY